MKNPGNVGSSDGRRADVPQSDVVTITMIITSIIGSVMVYYGPSNIIRTLTITAAVLWGGSVEYRARGVESVGVGKTIHLALTAIGIGLILLGGWLLSGDVLPDVVPGPLQSLSPHRGKITQQGLLMIPLSIGARLLTRKQPSMR